jgi:hypothetical protein
LREAEMLTLFIAVAVLLAFVFYSLVAVAVGFSLKKERRFLREEERCSRWILKNLNRR